MSVVQCFKFGLRLQQPGEAVATFIAKLRQLDKFCEYEDMLDDILRD